jgi:hypothetical protein
MAIPVPRSIDAEARDDNLFGGDVPLAVCPTLSAAFLRITPRTSWTSWTNQI